MKKTIKKEEPKAIVVKTKTWTIKVDEMSDGSKNMIRRNDGFDPLELLGLGMLMTKEVSDQIMGRIKPDTIKREVVVD